VYADREALAKHNGQPLLNDEGMVAIDGLLTAHEAYDEAGKMHADRIRGLQARINDLELEKARLISEKDQAVSTQHRARHSHAYGVKKATEPSQKSNNKAYAAILRSWSESSGSLGNLWYPQALAVADEMGRSFVGLDEALRSNNRSQPAMLTEIERGNGYVNLFLGRTNRKGGLEVTTTTTSDKCNLGQRVNRIALALPIKEGSASTFQLHPNILSREEHLDDYTREPSKYASIQDGFKLAISRGSGWDSSHLGEYDLPDGGTSELRGQFGWEGESRATVAIGNLSVARALLDLQTSFSEKSLKPDSIIPIFEQLGQRALGKSLVEIQQV
jgi:hypothetical protein